MPCGCTNNTSLLAFGTHQSRPWTSSRELKQNATKRNIQVLIVYLGLALEEAHYPWSKDGHEYPGIELLEHFVKVCLPLTKTKKLPKDAPIEHPCLPDFPTLGTLSLDVANYYTEQAKSENELRLKALREREKEVLMGIWDGAEYMNEVNWPEKSLKTGYKIEMCFSYPDAEE